MGEYSRAILKWRPLDLENRGFTSGKRPKGIRTPHGQIWGHDMDDFYDIRPFRNEVAPIYWSVSMMREFGIEFWGRPNGLETDLRLWFNDNSKARVRKPWPLIKLSEGAYSQEVIGVEDEGSDYCQNRHENSCEKNHFHLDGDLENNPTRKTTGEEAENVSINDGDSRRRASVLSDTCEKHYPEGRWDLLNQNETSLKRKSKSLPEVATNEKNIFESGSLGVMDDPSFKKRRKWVESEQNLYAPETISGTDLPPKLEEFIPKEFLPDVLLVYDPDGCTNGRQGLKEFGEPTTPILEENRKPIRYRRIPCKTQCQCEACKGDFTFR